MNDVFADETRYSLGDLDPARSRHNWTRSATFVAGDVVFAGRLGGSMTAYRPDSSPPEAWTSSSNRDTDDPSGARDRYVVSLAHHEDLLVAGERGPEGYVTAISAATGETRWQYATVDDVGPATQDSLLFQPYVVDVSVSDGTTVAASRRYERDGQRRDWSSVVVGFDSNGDVRWRYGARASPIALDVADGRVAVAYNRCPEGHGLVVLDGDSGTPILRWDPDTDGDRRVGDVGFVADGVAVASHGDKRGYLLDADGCEVWHVDLASERRVGDETVYAYPNQVCASDGVAVFVTGNTYAESTREPDARHPRQHTAIAVDEGEIAWTHEVGGFARDVSANGSLVAVPSAQNFRERTSDTHAVHLFDARGGHRGSRSIPGIASASALGTDTLAVVEEPVEYHDENVVHGSYRLHTWKIDGHVR